MVMNVKFEVYDDDKTLFIANVGEIEQQYFLNLTSPELQKTIKTLWLKENIVKFGTNDLTEGLPIEIIFDNLKPKTVYYRNERLYESGQSDPWDPEEINDWFEILSPIFMRDIRGTGITSADINIDRMLAGTRDFDDWVACVGSYAALGAGIGAMIGWKWGGLYPANKPLGKVAGGGAGAVLGSIIGTGWGFGWCGAKEFDKNRRRLQEPPILQQ